MERRIPFVLTSDEPTFRFLVDNIKRSEGGATLTLHMRPNFSELSESAVLAAIFRKVYEAAEGNEAPAYADNDPRIVTYLDSYFTSGRPILVAIRFSEDFDPKTAGSYETFFNPG